MADEIAVGHKLETILKIDGQGKLQELNSIILSENFDMETYARTIEYTLRFPNIFG